MNRAQRITLAVGLVLFGLSAVFVPWKGEEGVHTGLARASAWRDYETYAPFWAPPTDTVITPPDTDADSIRAWEDEFVRDWEIQHGETPSAAFLNAMRESGESNLTTWTMHVDMKIDFVQMLLTWVVIAAATGAGVLVLGLRREATND